MSTKQKSRKAIWITISILAVIIIFTIIDFAIDVVKHFPSEKLELRKELPKDFEALFDSIEFKKIDYKYFHHEGSDIIAPMGYEKKYNLYIIYLNSLDSISLLNVMEVDEENFENEDAFFADYKGSYFHLKIASPNSEKPKKLYISVEGELKREKDKDLSVYYRGMLDNFTLKYNLKGIEQISLKGIDYNSFPCEIMLKNVDDKNYILLLFPRKKSQSMPKLLEKIIKKPAGNTR